MRLFAGLSRTDYEEVFRAIGALLDERGWTNVALMEVEEGLVLQGMPKATYQDKPTLEVYLLTDADVEAVMRDALARRHAAGARATPRPEPDSQATAKPPTEARPPARSAGAVDDTAKPSRPPESTSRVKELGDWRNRPGDLPLPSFDEQQPADPLAVTPPEQEPELDLGAARAAVVMAHVVAAHLRSGIPLTGDDPDLKALLEQVQALDKTGIGADQ